jgi:hypothetical protein
MERGVPCVEKGPVQGVPALNVPDMCQTCESRGAAQVSRMGEPTGLGASWASASRRSGAGFASPPKAWSFGTAPQRPGHVHLTSPSPSPGPIYLPSKDGLSTTTSPAAYR